MQWLFVEHLFTREIIQALTWTFIHSLWQGLILAIITGIALVLTKKSSPHLRYNLLIALFLAFVLVVGFTFRGLLHTATGAPATLSAVSSSALYIPDNVAGKIITSSIWQKVSVKFIDYCTANAPLFITIWFIIFSAKFVHLIAGLVYIRRIRHYRVQQPSQQWIELLRTLVENMHIQKPVSLLESALIKVPMVAGFLKPVIIVPIGLLSHLSPDQVEAILLHELAHIQRKDYFVNLLQSFVEIIFFFNPPVLWISSLIREEREHCCDDIAVEYIRSKSKYIDALVSFQEYNLSLFASRSIVAFAGKKNHLLNRVKRIVSDSNKSLNIFERVFLICSIALLVLAVSMPAYESRAEKLNPIVSPTNTTQTMPNSQTFEVIKNGKKYKIIKVNNKISQFFIDDQSVPVQNIATEYAWLLNAMEQAKVDAARAKSDQEQRDSIEQERASKEREKISIDQERIKKDLEKKDQERLRLDEEKARNDREQENQDRAREQQRRTEEAQKN